VGKGGKVNNLPYNWRKVRRNNYASAHLRSPGNQACDYTAGLRV